MADDLSRPFVPTLQPYAMRRAHERRVGIVVEVDRERDEITVTATGPLDTEDRYLSRVIPFSPFASRDFVGVERELAKTCAQCGLDPRYGYAAATCVSRGTAGRFFAWENGDTGTLSGRWLPAKPAAPLPERPALASVLGALTDRSDRWWTKALTEGWCDVGVWLAANGAGRALAAWSVASVAEAWECLFARDLWPDGERGFVWTPDGRGWSADASSVPIDIPTLVAFASLGAEQIARVESLAPQAFAGLACNRIVWRVAPVPRPIERPREPGDDDGPTHLKAMVDIIRAGFDMRAPRDGTVTITVPPIGPPP